MERSMCWSILALVFACALVGPREAEACGGFFCDSPPPDPPPDEPDLPLPVYQTGELVLFVADETQVEAHIQIQYAGEANEFSWVVPVQAVPEIDFGSDEAFFALAAQTTPSFPIDNRRAGCPTCLDCPIEDNYYYGGDTDSDMDADVDTDADSDADGDGGEEVHILDSGVVGPFETVTLASDDAAALTTWLSDNGYVIPETAYPIIDSYVSAGFYFVGLKLTKDATTGDLRPIVLRMTGANLTPCVPLRLTAIAAAQEMPVRVWVLGDQRAVSTNYHDVEVNDLPAAAGFEGYDPLVSRAIDEAGGRGFVTEYAGDSIGVTIEINPSQFNTSTLETISDPAQFLDAMVSQGFTQSRLVLGLLRQYIPKPEGLDVSDATFYECLECDVYYGYDAGCTECYEDDIVGQPFDPVGFASALEENIVRPMRELHAQFRAHPYLTALHGTMSPNEMTVDPEFAYRSDLPPVAAARPAIRTEQCRGSIAEGDDYTQMSTAAGLVASYRSLDANQPALLRAYLRDGGDDELVMDQEDDILEVANGAIPEAVAISDDVYCECGRSDGRDQASNPQSRGGDGDAGSRDGGSLCAAAPGGSARGQGAFVLLLLFVFGVVGVVRRAR